MQDRKAYIHMCGTPRLTAVKMCVALDLVPSDKWWWLAATGLQESTFFKQQKIQVLLICLQILRRHFNLLQQK